MTDWDRCRSKHVLVENTERKPEFASGTADTSEAAKAAALFETRARHNLPNEACRENVLLLLSLQSNFIATAAQCGTNNHAYRSGIRGMSAQLWEGSQRKCWTPMIWRYGTRSIG